MYVNARSYDDKTTRSIDRQLICWLKHIKRFKCFKYLKLDVIKIA
jgi:hypothetical protein